MITGSLVPNITLFDKDGNIDQKATRWHMDWMFGHGVNGLFLTGSYGAGPLMSNEERELIYTIAKQAADAADGDRILIAHVGCIDTASTTALARAAERIGVDAVAAVPPFYYKHNADVVIRFYRDLIDSVSIPVYAYNNPGTSRFTFDLKTVRTLREAGLAGLKDSPLSVGFVSRVFYESKLEGAPFQVILGTSTGWFPFTLMGIRAAIAGINNWAPEIMTELVRSTFTGEQDRAELAYLVMMDISAKMHFTDSTIASHMGLYARGFKAGFPRKPMLLPSFDDPKYGEIRDQIQGAFDRLGLTMQTGDWKA
jgi:dihydrodipicolinate synthase/N-acetylneuraminate lyase